MTKRKTREFKTRDVVEFVGAAGGLLKQVFGAFEQPQTGNVVGALKGLSPKAISDIGKGAGMLANGHATDARSRRTADTLTVDAIAKMIGFNPTTIAEDSRARSIVMDQAMLHKTVQGRIHDQWAQGIIEKDPEKVASARDLLRRWNERNPESKIVPSNAAILRRVQQARLTADQRMINTTPKQMREQMRPLLSGDYR